MALRRELLETMGIEKEKINEIINAHVETVDALKKERDEYRDKCTAYKADAEKLPDVQKQLDELKANIGKDSYKEKYEKEHNDFEAYKADVEAKEIFSRKTSAYRKLLAKLGISEKRIDAILRVSVVDDIELDKDDNIKNADQLEKKLKDEWKEFIPKEGTKGAETDNPPAGNGNGGKMTLEQIDAIKDTAERQKAMLENPELFGL